MHLTSGLLLNARDLFLDFPIDYSGQDDFIYKGMEVREVLEFLFFIGVIEEKKNQIIKLNEIADRNNLYDLLQIFILNYIKKRQFYWVKRADLGRKKILNLLDSDDDLKQKDILSCLNQANLTKKEFTEASEAWWTELADFARSLRKDAKSEIGRKGEELSYAYEKGRVGKFVEKKYLEDNTIGYDLLSWIDQKSEGRLCIEVKTSEKGLNNPTASFFLTKNEWEKSTEITNYKFHIWDINEPSNPLLAVLSSEEVLGNIPKDQGSGEWKNVEISLEEFRKDFLQTQ